MKYFGTVDSFDVVHGSGSIKPEIGGDNLKFEKNAFSWDIKATPPKTGQRLSYEVGTTSDNKNCARNLETI